MGIVNRKAAFAGEGLDICMVLRGAGKEDDNMQVTFLGKVMQCKRDVLARALRAVWDVWEDANGMAAALTVSHAIGLWDLLGSTYTGQ